MSTKQEQLLQGSNDWYFVIDSNGTFLYASKALFTLKKEELLQEGLDIFDHLLDEDNKEALAIELQAINEGGQIRTFPLNLLNIELNEYASFLARAWPLKNGLVALQLINQTEIVKREKVLTMKENEIDLLMNSFFKKRHQVVNTQYYQQLLKTIMQAVEADIIQIFAQDQQSDELHLIAAMQEKYVSDDLDIKNSQEVTDLRSEILIDGNLNKICQKPCQDLLAIVVSPIKLQGNKKGYLITGSVDKYNFDWKKVRLLNKSALALSNLLSIDLVYWEQQKIEKMKDQFLSLVSHELRSPITVIKGNISLLKKNQSTTEMKSTIEIVDRSLDRLNRLVDDILDVTRIQYGDVKFNISQFQIF